MAHGTPNNHLSPEDVHAYWTKEAIRHGLSPSASWSDHPVIELEIQAIGPRVAHARTLDVGCANGYSSIAFATGHGAQVLGIDYVEEMVTSALQRREALPDELQARVEFRLGDARSLDLEDATFERVVSTRVMINLSGWEEQRLALGECLRVLRPGGLLLLSEATVGGWSRLNALRTEWGLDAIPMPAFNLYLDESKVIDLLLPDAELVALEDFASSYYVATRFLKPILARGGQAQSAVDVADPHSEFNRWASSLPPAGDYGTQKLFVFAKRAT
ncbi:MAG: class I SAM-dependent methyltransferase [Thermoleophilaceae bacterium]|nr:class I SAM-dependent methyltransferase [Thermoleophilaceae bacterium]